MVLGADKYSRTSVCCPGHNLLQQNSLLHRLNQLPSSLSRGEFRLIHQPPKAFDVMFWKIRLLSFQHHVQRVLSHPLFERFKRHPLRFYLSPTQSSQYTIEVLSSPVQTFLTNRIVQRHQSLKEPGLAQYDNEQGNRLLEKDKLQALQPRRPRSRLSDYGQICGKPGKSGCTSPGPFFNVGLRLAEPPVHSLPQPHGQRRYLAKRLNIVAIPKV